MDKDFIFSVSFISEAASWTIGETNLMSIESREG